MSVDGRQVTTLQNQLNNFAQYTPLADAELSAGFQTATLHHGGPDLQPGSGGP